MRLARGSPQADLRPGRLPTDFSMEPERKPPRTSTGVPNRNPVQTQGLPTSRITTREAPHKQNYVRPGGSPQAELQPGSLCTHKQNYNQGAYVPTSRIATRDLAGSLARGITYDQGACHALGWLASWGAGWLVGCGQERPRQAQKGGAWIEQACPGVQSMLYVSLLVFLYRDTYICTYTHMYKERPRESM